MKKPKNIDAEKAILGCLMHNNEMYKTISHYANDKTMYDKTNQLMFQVIGEVIKSGKVCDMITAVEHVTSSDKYNGSPSPHYVSELFVDYDWISTDSLESYAKIVYEKHLLRDVVTKSKLIEEKANNCKSDVYDFLGEVNSEINELISLKPSQSFNLKEVMDETIKDIENCGGNLISSGIDEIDKLCGGLTRGEVTIIGGRPGHGKTTLALNIISRMVNAGLKVLFFSREMTNIEILKKLIALESGNISITSLRTGEFKSDEEFALVLEAKEHVSQVYGDNGFELFDNVPDMATAMSIINKVKPDVVFDDYIQLIKTDSRIEQRRLQIEYIVHNYKWLAKTQKCCIILLSQLNRMMESRKSLEPRLSDLAESGAIEQVAENVFFVYYDYKVHLENSEAGPNSIRVICSKVRYGNSGKVNLGYDGDKARIYNSIEDYENKNFY